MSGDGGPGVGSQSLVEVRFPHGSPSTSGAATHAPRLAFLGATLWPITVGALARVRAPDQPKFQGTKAIRRRLFRPPNSTTVDADRAASVCGHRGQELAARAPRRSSAGSVTKEFWTQARLRARLQTLMSCGRPLQTPSARPNARRSALRDLFSAQAEDLPLAGSDP